MISGTVDNCELISCRGTLIIGETAKVNCKRIEADCLINLGHTIADKIVVPGTLVAWSGSITGKQIQYAAFEKSARCAVKGSLDEITGQPIPVPAPAFIAVPELEPPKRLKAVALESTADTKTSPAQLITPTKESQNARTTSQRSQCRPVIASDRCVHDHQQQCWPLWTLKSNPRMIAMRSLHP